MKDEKPHASPSVLDVFRSRKMAALLILGFSSGLPLYLTGQGRAIQAWMTKEGVDLTTIGFFSLVALPFSLKFLWAPVMDRFIPPFLGRRRGWLLITQVALLLAIAAMSLQDPQLGLRLLAFNAILIAFFSASQDIVIDAYRTDVLSEREMGAGAATWVLGYRVAMLTTGALALLLADQMPWTAVYLVMAALLLIGFVGTFLAPEPVLHDPPPQTFADAVVLPFKEFFTRETVLKAFLVLAFIVLYKLPDYFAASMATPFLLETGFTQTDIGALAGGLGLGATIVGALAGGGLVARIGINRSLWVFGVLQAVSNLAYYLLALAGKSYGFLVATMIVENFCQGLVTAGFIAFLMSLCSVRFSATQYALLSSLMGASRDVLVAPSGSLAEATGWPLYFLLTVIAAVPGLLLLPFFAPWNREAPTLAAVHTGEAEEEPSPGGPAVSPGFGPG
jgi:PAT family beta-lactamase induction signal transducer AmpG